MKEPFRQKVSQLSGTAESLTASASVPSDSVWYAGHFPGAPLLPGIAILALVQEAICEAGLREGRRVTVTGVSRVRFRLPIKPDDAMVIQVSEEKRNEGYVYGFSVFLSGELACGGFFHARVAAA